MSVIKNLQEFNSSFGTEPAEVKIQCGKDATFSIYLKPLTSAARDNFEASVVGVEGKRDLHNLRARLVSKCWVDDKGKPFATEKDIGDMRADIVGAIFDKVRELNGMDEGDVEAAGKD